MHSTPLMFSSRKVHYCIVACMLEFIVYFLLVGKATAARVIHFHSLNIFHTVSTRWFMTVSMPSSSLVVVRRTNLLTLQLEETLQWQQDSVSLSGASCLMHLITNWSPTMRVTWNRSDLFIVSKSNLREMNVFLDY